jgi:hypothetical protein
MKELSGCWLAVFFVVGLASTPSFTQSVNVTTWHNDNGRTGQNTNEITLTTAINKNNFGRVCSYALTEQIYAQPLVLASITIGGVQHEAVYVVTMADNIYVFDGANYNGTTCILLQGPISLIPSNEAPVDCTKIAGGCKPLSPTVGALGTPVIDASTNTLYVVTESQYPKTNPTNFYHRLHALDLTSPSLAEKYNGPATIPSAAIGGATFHSKQEIQRPGLLLTYEEPVPTYPTVYIAFSMMDGTKPNPTGWIFAYDAHDLTSSNFPLIYATVQNPETGGYFGGAFGRVEEAWSRQGINMGVTTSTSARATGFSMPTTPAQITVIALSSSQPSCNLPTISPQRMRTTAGIAAVLPLTLMTSTLARRACWRSRLTPT